MADRPPVRRLARRIDDCPARLSRTTPTTVIDGANARSRIDRERAPDGALVRPPVTRGPLVDDRDRRRRRVVADSVNARPAIERNSHHLEIVRAHTERGPRLQRRVDLAAGVERHRRVVEVASDDSDAGAARPADGERNLHAERRGFDAGNAGDVREQPVGGRKILRLDATRMHRHRGHVGDVLGVVAECHARKPRDRLHHEPCRDEQRHGARGLNDDEGLLHAMSAARERRRWRAPSRSVVCRSSSTRIRTGARLSTTAMIEVSATANATARASSRYSMPATRVTGLQSARRTAAPERNSGERESEHQSRDA